MSKPDQFEELIKAALRQEIESIVVPPESRARVAERIREHQRRASDPSILRWSSRMALALVIVALLAGLGISKAGLWFEDITAGRSVEKAQASVPFRLLLPKPLPSPARFRELVTRRSVDGKMQAIIKYTFGPNAFVITETGPIDQASSDGYNGTRQIPIGGRTAAISTSPTGQTRIQLLVSNLEIVIEGDLPEEDLVRILERLQ